MSFGNSPFLVPQVQTARSRSLLPFLFRPRVIPPFYFWSHLIAPGYFSFGVVSPGTAPGVVAPRSHFALLFLAPGHFTRLFFVRGHFAPESFRPFIFGPRSFRPRSFRPASLLLDTFLFFVSPVSPEWRVSLSRRLFLLCITFVQGSRKKSGCFAEKPMVRRKSGYHAEKVQDCKTQRDVTQKRNETKKTNVALSTKRRIFYRVFRYFRSLRVRLRFSLLVAKNKNAKKW